MTVTTNGVRGENYTYSATEKSVTNADVVSQYQKVIEEKIAELSARLNNGEDQKSYQIGAQSFTEREWNKLLDEYDYVQDELKKLMRERHTEQYEKKQEKNELEEDKYKEDMIKKQIEKLLEDKNRLMQEW